MRGVHRPARRRRRPRRASCSPCRRTAPRSSPSRGWRRPTASSATCSRRCTPATACSAGSAPRASSSRSPPCSRRNPDPDDDEIRDGLSGNLCRCTGYQGIIEAVQVAAAARERRSLVTAVEERPAVRRRPATASSASGSRAARTPGSSPATARYVDDIVVPGMLHVAFAAQRRRPRHDHRDRRRGGARRCPASSPCSPAPTSTATCTSVGRLRGRRRRPPVPAASPTATSASSASRSRWSSPSPATSPRTPATSSSVDIDPLDADRRPRRRAGAAAPGSCTRSATSNVVRRHPGRRRSRARRHLRRAPPTSSPRRSTSTATLRADGDPRRRVELGRRSATSSVVDLDPGRRTACAASSSRALGLAENRVRVVMGDVGGGFGQKMFMLPEELAVVLAGKRLGRPVKWIEDRRENLMAGQHARDDRMTRQLGARRRRAHPRRARSTSSRTSARSRPPAAARSASSGCCFPGPYRIPRIGFSAQAVYTNTCGRCSYRGPWMMETVAREQMMDIVARRLGIDPLELRRRNVVRDDDLPYTMRPGMVYDQVSIAALARAGRRDDRLRRAPRRAGRGARRGAPARHRRRACTSSRPGWPSAAWPPRRRSCRIGVNGQVQALMSSGSHGQSLETTVAQVVADELGVDIDDVTVIQGDTASAPFGPGTGGSRSAVHPQRGGRRGGRRRCGRRCSRSPPTSSRRAARTSRSRTGGRPSSARRRRPCRSPRSPGSPTSTRPALPPGMALGLEAKARVHAERAVHVVERVPRLPVRGRPAHRAGRRSCATSSARTAA